MNIEQLEDLALFCANNPLNATDSEGDIRKKNEIRGAVEHLREVAQAALDLIPKDTLLVEVMETRNDLIDSFNLIDDQ
jgi:hypothetical protein